MRFRLVAQVNDDGKGNYQFEVPDGATVFRVEAAQMALAALNWCMAAPNVRILTASEAAAELLARTLPDGWTATLDAVNIEIQAETGARRFSRTYRFADDAATTMLAPCAEDGSPLPVTRQVLLSMTPSDAAVASAASEA